MEEEPFGSSDIGIVSYICPALHGYVKIAEHGVNGHSKEMASVTISEAGKKGLRDGAIALAMIGYRLLSEQGLLEEVKAEFQQQKEAGCKKICEIGKGIAAND